MKKQRDTAEIQVVVAVKHFVNYMELEKKDVMNVEVVHYVYIKLINTNVINVVDQDFAK